MNASQNPTPGTGTDDTSAATASTAAATELAEDATVQTAGAFDIRNFIGSLLGLFGLILVGAGVFAFDAEVSAKTEGLNANLWAGLALVAVALGFLLWTKLDPIRMVVRDNEEGAEHPHDIAPLD